MINGEEDMPYYDPFTKPSNIPSDDGYYKIYMRPNYVYEKLYQSYSTIVSAVEAWFNSGLKTAYAAFDSIIKAKESNTEAFLKNVLLVSNSVILSDPNAFMRHLVKNIYEHDLNICGNINHDAMDANAHELESVLDSLVSGEQCHNSLLHYKVENSYEIRPDPRLKISSIRQSLIFKIRPILECILHSTLYKDMSNLIPVCRYDVLLDYNSICNYCIGNATYPNNIEEIVDEETFINNNMYKFKGVINDISRKIILEIFDRITDISGNFDKFNSKTATLTRSILKSDLNNSVINKLRYLCRSTLSEELPGDSKYFNDLFNKIDDRNIFSEIYDRYKTNDGFNPYMETYNGDIIDNIINCNNAYYNGVNEKIENLCYIYYGFAFSHFFEDEVIYEYLDKSYYDGYDEDDIIEHNKPIIYAKEFDKKYNYNDLLIQTTKIDDYNLRDFYKLIINESITESSFYYIENYRLKNGERETFLVSKAKRCVACYMLGFMMTIKRLMDYISLLESKKVKPDQSELCDKLCISIKETIDLYVNRIKRLTSDAILDNISEFFGQNCSSFSHGTYPKLDYMISILTNHIKLISESKKRGDVPYLRELQKFFKIDEDYHMHGRYYDDNIKDTLDKSFDFITDDILINY